MSTIRSSWTLSFFLLCVSCDSMHLVTISFPELKIDKKEERYFWCLPFLDCVEHFLLVFLTYNILWSYVCHISSNYSYHGMLVSGPFKWYQGCNGVSAHGCFFTKELSWGIDNEDHTIWEEWVPRLVTNLNAINCKNEMY